jgi:ABC-2 type transport system permease protein
LWIIFFSIKDNIGGYVLKDVLLLWALASGTYAICFIFFGAVTDLPNLITQGKIDSFLVQPKNVLISILCSKTKVSAIGDLIYAYIMLFIYDISITSFLLFTLFIICGGLIVTSVSVIFSSLSFWFNKSDVITDTANSLMINFATYPDGIFKGIVRVFMYTILPVGVVNYLPVKILTKFDLGLTFIILFVTILFVSLAFVMFYRGLRKYSSSNLMIAKI